MLTELQYFGSISYITALLKAKDICIDNNDSFTKMSFKNRTIIASAQGPLNLTIPIIGGRDQKNKLTDIRIDYSTSWQNQHLKSIQSCYRRAPFFDYYEESITSVIGSTTDNLFDYLVLSNVWVQKQFKNSWITHTNGNSNIQETFRDKWLPKNFQECKNINNYYQVFEIQNGFIPNLSILDILFCCGGKQAQELLISS
jgi:hypothetical protein